MNKYVNRYLKLFKLLIYDSNLITQNNAYAPILICTQYNVFLNFNQYIINIRDDIYTIILELLLHNVTM